MGVLLGTCVAIAYGGADFLGGFTSRHSPPGSVLAVVQGTGLVTALFCAALFSATLPGGNDVALSVAAGITGVAGLACLYRGLALGRMSVVAPLSAIGVALVPFAWGLIQGERPSGPALVGVALALAATVVIARGKDAAPPDAASRWSELALATAAGLGLGAAFVLYAETSSDTGVWPVVIGRAVGVAAVGGLILVLGRWSPPARDDRAQVVSAGFLDSSANMLQLVAVRGRLISLIAPVAALYPVATVLLARVILREPIGRVRGAALLVALAGLLLIATGESGGPS